jgi:hypothetical protein
MSANISDQVEYDSFLGCFVLHYGGEAICLGAETHAEALEEAERTIAELNEYGYVWVDQASSV